MDPKILSKLKNGHESSDLLSSPFFVNLMNFKGNLNRYLFITR